MRSIDFTPEQEGRRAMSTLMIRKALLYLDTPEHRMMVLACLMDGLISEVTDPAAGEGALVTLAQTHQARMALFAGPGGSA